MAARGAGRRKEETVTGKVRRAGSEEEVAQEAFVTLIM